MSVFCVLPHFNVRNDMLSVLFDLHVHAVINNSNSYAFSIFIKIILEVHVYL